MSVGERNRWYFTNSNFKYEIKCEGIKNNGYCGIQGTHDNAEVMNNNLEASASTYCNIYTKVCTENTVNMPSVDLSIGWARYEFGNCSGSTRNGTIEWGHNSQFAFYEAARKISGSWVIIYSGTSTYASFNTSHTGQSYSFRVRGVSDLDDEAPWRTFSGQVPNCSGGGGLPVF